MKLIIAGSRNVDQMVDTEMIQQLVLDHFELPDEVICGMARGPDLIGKQWADEYTPEWSDVPIPIPVKEFPANWDLHGKKAGFIRNGDMSVYGDALLAIWDGKSRGTQHMIQCMLNKDKPFYVELIT